MEGANKHRACKHFLCQLESYVSIPVWTIVQVEKESILTESCIMGLSDLGVLPTVVVICKAG
jgi:hypothetical protein